MKKILFNEEYCAKNREIYVLRALKGEDFIESTVGYLGNLFPSKHIFLTSSATTALEVAFLAAGIPSGAQVLIPSYTFPSVGNVVIRAGLTPVFFDIDDVTLTLDMNEMAKKITSSTKAVALAHYGGVSADLDLVKEFCKRYDLLLIEDAATAFDAKYKGKALGTFGDFGVFSFHSTKNISAEQGGVLLVDEDSLYLTKVEQAYEDGTNRNAFLRGDVDFYEWTGLGTNVRMTNLNAAVLLSSLEEKDVILRKRKKIWQSYKNRLLKFEEIYPIKTMKTPSYSDDNAHVFYVRFEKQDMREQVRKRLLNLGIVTNFHYMPLHLSAMGKKYAKDYYPVTETVANTLLRLPLHMNLSNKDIDFVISSLGNSLKEIYE